MVHGKEHTPSSLAPIMSSEHNCRRGVQNMVRQVGMKAFPNPILGNQSFGGLLFTDLFASRLSSQLPVFVSWRPGSHNCIYSRLEYSSRENVCQSTLRSESCP